MHDNSSKWKIEHEGYSFEYRRFTTREVIHFQKKLEETEGQQSGLRLVALAPLMLVNVTEDAALDMPYDVLDYVIGQHPSFRSE